MSALTDFSTSASLTICSGIGQLTADQSFSINFRIARQNEAAGAADAAA